MAIRITVGRSPVRLDTGLSAGDKFELQNLSNEQVRYSHVSGASSPVAATATVYLGYPLLTQAEPSSTNYRGSGTQAPANPVAGEVFFDAGHLLTVPFGGRQHHWRGRWQHAVSRINPLSGQPEVIWSQGATIDQLRTALQASTSDWIAPEIGGAVTVVSAAGAPLPLGGEFPTADDMFDWYEGSGRSTTDFYYYDAGTAKVYGVSAYTARTASGPAITATISQTGTKPEDIHARGAQGNSWRIARSVGAATAVDAATRTITVGGATAGAIAAELTGLPDITITTSYTGGATANSPVRRAVAPFSFTGGVDAGPTDASRYLVLPPGRGLVPQEVQSTPCWAWLAAGTTNVVAQVARRRQN